MYGTVAKMRVKPGGIEALNRVMEGREQPSEAVGVYAFQMDADPNEVYMVAIFESKESYVANAQSPEQHAQYVKMMEWLEAEPEWHDGEIAYASE